MSIDNKFILVGGIEAGKSTLFTALLDRTEKVRKTQALEFDGGIIDTPGEFFSHPRMYHALINTAADVDTIIYVHAADNREFRLPPGLLDVNSHKRLIGVISKVDLPGARVAEVEAMLRSNGFRDQIFHTSIHQPDTIQALKKYLKQDFAGVESHETSD